MRRAIGWLMVLAAIGVSASFAAGVVSGGSSEGVGGTTQPGEFIQADSAPRFESFTVSGLQETRIADSQGPSHWCGPLGVGRFDWSISGGTEPLEIAVAGQLVNPEARSVDIPCPQIRRAYLSGPQPSASVVQVIAEVRDTNNQSGSAAIAIGFVSDAPKDQIEEIEVYAGVQDAFFVIHPWSFHFSPMDPMDLMAVVRYREAGSADWSSVVPLPDPPQSGCVFRCLTPHVSDLDRAQAFEYQAAWMWMEKPWEWRERPPLFADWWRAWTTPDALNWTKIQHFRTYGDEDVIVEAEDHRLSVSWRPRGGAVHTWLTSPDWPGAIWTDPENPYRRPMPTREAEEEEGWSTAIFHGLPADTRFVVTFKRALPDRFAQVAPEEYLIRTKPDTSALTPGVFDPRGVKVAWVDDELHVEWNGRSADWWAGVSLYAWDSRVGRTRLGYRQSYSMSLPGSGVIYVHRQQMVIEHVKPKPGMVLYLNVRPASSGPGSSRYPFVCMAWTIELAPTNPDLMLDWYFHSTWLKSGTGITPVKSYWLSSDGNRPYSRCDLGDYVGE